jgi:hypothetical protein
MSRPQLDLSDTRQLKTQPRAPRYSCVYCTSPSEFPREPKGRISVVLRSQAQSNSILEPGQPISGLLVRPLSVARVRYGSEISPGLMRCTVSTAKCRLRLLKRQGEGKTFDPFTVSS